MKDASNLRENLNRVIAQLEESDKQREVSRSVTSLVESSLIGQKLEERASRADQLQQQCTELRSDIASLSGLVQQSNFKTTHYNTLKRSECYQPHVNHSPISCSVRKMKWRKS